MTPEPRAIVLRPVVSEKSVNLSDVGVYTFEVARGANKIEIRKAIESIWEVRVVKVNTLNRRGKRIRNRGRSTFGRRPDVKHAMVTLAEGDSIDPYEVG